MPTYSQRTEIRAHREPWICDTISIRIAHITEMNGATAVASTPASGSVADVELEKTFVRNSSNCYLRHMGKPGPCPWLTGVEAGFCQHPKCSADDCY